MSDQDIGVINHHPECPHCKKQIHEAPFQGLAWIFAMLSLFLMLPSFFYPIVAVEQLGERREVSFVQGIVELIRDEKYPLAIFLAVFSGALPVLKNSLLVFLCSGIPHFFPRISRILYSFIEFAGAWGKLEIFVTAIVLVVTGYSHQIMLIEVQPAFFLFVSMILSSLTASWIYN